MKYARLVACIQVTAFSIALGGAVSAGPDEKTPQPGLTFRDCSDCPEMVVIPAGRFLMGSSDEETARDVDAVLPSIESKFAKEYMLHEHPRHQVNIDRPFALGKYRVTRGEFAAFVRETGYSTEGGCTLLIDDDYLMRPEAGWQNPGCDGPYRLPSEAEWEYAARAGTETVRWWGDSIGSGNADCYGCGSPWDKQQPAPAGSFQANAFGLSDVLGSAWQWTEDCWNEAYAGSPQDGSAWRTGKCELRVMRGGDWSSRPWVLRSANRTRQKPSGRNNSIGFRVAETLP